MAQYSPVLNPGRWRFAPRPLATVATVAAVIALVALGCWQLDRGEEKRALAADFLGAGPAIELPPAGAALTRYQRVVARGSYDAGHQFLLDNRIRAGVAGVEVLTPLLLGDGSAVLVNRGWLPFGNDRGQLPAVAVGTQARHVAGRFNELPRAPVELPSPPSPQWPRLVNYPQGAELAAMLGRELRPGMILLDPGEPDGYDRDWQPPGTTPERHLGYAVQWFALAATAAAIWFAHSLSRDGETG
ncbi:MAG TPA: SURF1 family protein [Steroidobacteraceae bacterium]|nr:SURF1 family protein [Steroidobacteraceae bacterium]